MSEELSEEMLWILLENELSDGLDAIWDMLSPKQRKKVFPKLITEFVEANY